MENKYGLMVCPGKKENPSGRGRVKSRPRLGGMGICECE